MKSVFDISYGERGVTPLIIVVLALTIQLPSSAYGLDSTYVFWTDNGTQKIQRLNLDEPGAPIIDLLENAGDVYGIAVDPTAKQIYWTIKGPPGEVRRALWEGSREQSLITSAGGGGTGPVASFKGIALDLVNKKMYWSDSTNEKIERADFDGSNREDFVTQADNPDCVPVEDFVIDTPEDMIYWTPPLDNGVCESRLSVPNPTLSFRTTMEPMGLTGDRSTGIRYLTDHFSAEGSRFITRFGDPPGIYKRKFIDGLKNPWGIELSEGMLYWADATDGEIRRANAADGTGQDLVVVGLTTPRYLAIAKLSTGVNAEIRFVPFSSKYLLMALMAALGAWLILRRR